MSLDVSCRMKTHAHTVGLDPLRRSRKTTGLELLERSTPMDDGSLLDLGPGRRPTESVVRARVVAAEAGILLDRNPIPVRTLQNRRLERLLCLCDRHA